MMMTHTKALKTHTPFGDTRSLRPFDPIQQRLANDEARRRTALCGGSKVAGTTPRPHQHRI